jgi:cysteinyl-tRNA synthetase
MRLYNTQSQQIERVGSAQASILLYAAALPAPGEAHLGHGFTYVVNDCLLRFLEFQGRQVNYVQPLSASADNLRCKRSTEVERFTQGVECSLPFIQLMSLLNVCPPAGYALIKQTDTCWALTSVALEAPGQNPADLELISRLLTRYSPDSLRFYLLSHSYHTAWSFAEPLLFRAAEQFVTIMWALDVHGGRRQPLDPAPLSQCLLAALADDLNTPCALMALLFLAEAILAAAEVGRQVQAAQSTLRALSELLGLCLGKPPEARVVEGWQQFLPNSCSCTAGAPRAKKF